MRTGRVIMLIVGCLLLIPGVATLLGGGGLGLAYATQRDDDGFFDVTLDRIESETVAVTAEEVTFAAEPGSPDWVLDALDTDVRLRVTSGDSTRDVFVGIAREADVDGYLTGVSHDEVDGLDGASPTYRRRSGGDSIGAPTEETFWAVSDAGPGTRTVTWDVAQGRWAVIVMNADGSAGVSADVNAGARASFVLPLALILVGFGAAAIAGAIALIIGATRGERRTGDVATAAVAPPGVSTPSPVRVEASLDPSLSRWQWLVKWILAIPHVVVLVFLWVAFVVLTLVAGVSILVTGRYPHGIFQFNVGVMRWSWRVSYYAAGGGIGTDRYPPFSLDPAPGDPASLDVEYPAELRRPLVLVKWLLALPHLVIVAVLGGVTVRWSSADRLTNVTNGGVGLLSVLVLVAGVALLFTGRYPRALFDLIIGLNRWIYRVIAYVGLMTDEYPPFRLDQGGAEPLPTPPDQPLPAPQVNGDRTRDAVGVG